jgi:hypothetical protein
MTYIGTPYADNTNLFTGTITTTGAGSAIDVTGYATALLQLNGSTFRGIVTLERSLDGVVWYPCLVTEMNTMNQKTQIDALGIYAVRTEAQYLRYNVTNISGSLDLIIDGGTALISPVDKIAWAMDETNNSPLNVRLQAQNSGIKQDLSGAFILSDAPQAVTVPLQAINSFTIIDTQGYQSIEFTTQTFVGTVAGSNDGITFNSISGLSNTGVWTTTLASVNTNYIFPCQSRYIKVTATAAGTFTYVLRNIPFMGNNIAAIGGAAVSATTAQLGMNVVQVGGTGTVSGGVAGTLGVGGTNAVGATSASNPVLIGGVDPTGLARRATTTMLGDVITGNRTIPTSSAALSSATTGNTPIGGATFNNQIPHVVQDLLQHEGQNHVELLAQILTELKVLNQQFYELPKVLSLALEGPTAPQKGSNVQLGDDPFRLREESFIFTNQM